MEPSEDEFFDPAEFEAKAFEVLVSGGNPILEQMRRSRSSLCELDYWLNSDGQGALPQQQVLFLERLYRES